MVTAELAIQAGAPAGVNIAEMADFAPDEVARIRQLCAHYKVSPAQFYIYAAISKVMAPTIDKTLHTRVVHVEHLSTKQRREYLASPGQNWLDSFAKDLKTGFQSSQHRRLFS